MALEIKADRSYQVSSSRNRRVGWFVTPEEYSDGASCGSRGLCGRRLRSGIPARERVGPILGHLRSFHLGHGVPEVRGVRNNRVLWFISVGVVVDLLFHDHGDCEGEGEGESENENESESESESESEMSDG